MTDKYSKTPSFTQTALTSAITEFALPLAAGRGTSWRPSGTAVVIAPHLAITAKHVIEDYLQHFDGGVPGDGEFAGTFALKAFQVLNGGTIGALWTITRLWVSPFTDVAFLQLTPDSEAAARHHWRCVKLELIPPAVGSRIAGFGYHSPRIVVVENESEVLVEWHDTPATTIGEVTEVYDVQRDGFMLKFPCYRTTARFEGGMSGGPVFNDEGRLCGLVCSSFQSENVSFVATLWPSMGTLIDFPRADQPQAVSYPVLELAQRGYITAIGWERITLFPDRAGTRRIALTAS